jgi:sugar/nucleoside kinase (ribokinase family)
MSRVPLPGSLHVTALGNALVDVIARSDYEFVDAHDLERGATVMVDLERVESVYADLPPAQEISGGSAANTVAGLASFGASTAFIARVRDDQLGKVFTHDLRSLGVHFDVPPGTTGAATGRCLVIVTPDAQRSQCTYLGISSELGPDDVDPALIGAAQVTYLEGYLWDQPEAKEAIRKAAATARAAGRQVALTLSDPFCVDRHRVEFKHLVENDVDIVFANDDEICSLYEVSEFDEALDHVRRHCEIAALTRGPLGSVVIGPDEVISVPPEPVAAVVDTTGAGDQYAAGFLFGLTNGTELEVAGRLASLAAAEVISHLGARPEVSLRELAGDLLP